MNLLNGIKVTQMGQLMPLFCIYRIASTVHEIIPTLYDTVPVF